MAQLGGLAALLAVARKGVAFLLFAPALPFAKQALRDVQRLGRMTKRNTGKHIVHRCA